MHDRIHSCPVIAITCMDFRIRKWVNDWLDTQFGSADLLTYPGAVKGFTHEEESLPLLNAISIAVQKHHVTKVVLFNYEDCGAYGGSRSFTSSTNEQEFHTQQLKKAHTVIHREFPSLELALYFIRITSIKSPNPHWECRPLRIEMV